jgi:hypothetical protein
MDALQNYRTSRFRFYWKPLFAGTWTGDRSLKSSIEAICNTTDGVLLPVVAGRLGHTSIRATVDV